MARLHCRVQKRRGFTLVELLVVGSIGALLLSVLLPSLAKAKRSAVRTQCLSNLRQLEIAQITYSGDQGDALLAAGDGTEQGSWIGALRPYGPTERVRRCRDDRSPHFVRPVPGSGLPRLRTTSYGINNYVSPTHAPFGKEPIRRLSQVSRTARVIHLAELAETGAYAAADHLHVQDFYLAVAPGISIALIAKQMPLGRHGGKAESWEARLSYSFFDGHAEWLATRSVYTDPTHNLFDPAVAR